MEFDRLADQHRDAVYAQMVRLCGSREDAEDTLVQALLAAHQALPTLRDHEAFRGWLAKIARRVCYRLRNREELTALHELADLVSPDPDPQAELESRQMKGCLLDAVDALPPALKKAYVLCDIEEVRDASAAAQLGISLPALKSRLHRARRRMRENLERSLCADESFS